MATQVSKRTLFLTQFGILLAIEALFCFTPLGSLPAIGPIVATLAMIPVVITAILLGTAAGTLMGLAAGTFSFIVWTFMPPSPLVAFIFTPFYSLGDFQGNFGSLIICFVPRILTGTVAGLVFSAVKQQKISYIAAAALGSLTNTFLVMGGIWLFFSNQYEQLAGKAILAVIGTTVLFSGLPEAFVSAVIAPAVCVPLKKILNKPQ